MNITDLAWAAGFIDGEGTIALEKNSRYPTIGIHLYCGNTNEESLRKLKQLFNGNIYVQSRIKGYKPIYRWHIFGDKALTVIALLLPYLVVKQEHANLALAFKMCSRYKLTDKEREIREGLFKQLKLLNKRGKT